MNEPTPVPEPLRDLIDDYLSGLLDEAGVRRLEERLRADAEARRYFVRYARMHTDLHLEAHARQAGARALDRIAQQDRAAIPLLRWGTTLKMFAAAAGLLFVLGAGWWLVKGRPNPEILGHEPAIAWLVNAQNCQWSEGEPIGDMRAGKVLKLERGLAEVRFQCGARVVLEGPASLELLSAKGARLRYGKLTARVPNPATGFEIVCPQGKVIDLGTEFGVSVSASGATEVYVFEGKVEAHATANGSAASVNLTQNQAARIAAGKVQPVEPSAGASQFVRAIVPPPVIQPRTLRLTFDRPAEGGILDATGQGTGLTHRLPGTGRRLPTPDPNLRLNTEQQQLELTTTNSDLNTQYRLYHGEYLGIRLSDLGFTGKEDFAVTAVIPNIPALEFVGQFGLYAGVASDRNIRGGLLSSRRDEPGQYVQFLVNNPDGCDTDICKVGLLSTGMDLRLTLKRTDGRYALTVENLKDGSASTLTIRHPDFLDDEQDLFVGLFGANTQSPVRKTLFIKEFAVTVWTVAPAAGP
ncbi:MAG TPA: FecR domain-containing protein [Gemmataceae bacterium]|nr:FecR domain-containing protein [Gemmataceae bacterium]